MLIKQRSASQILRLKTRNVFICLIGLAINGGILFFSENCQASSPPTEKNSGEQPRSITSFQTAWQTQGEDRLQRTEVLMERLHKNPFPKNGPWRYLGQAMASFWLGDNETANKAVASLRSEMDKRTEEKEEGESNIGLQWQIAQVARLIFLFGQDGVRSKGAMTPEGEAVLKEMLWRWIEPRARMGLVDPSRDWWLWGSENLHLQVWFGIWSGLTLFLHDPAYANRKMADGSTIAELKEAFDDYFKRWIRLRATKGLLVECNSPTYTNYSLGGFYNVVDFSDDAELKRLATNFLDVYWAQWVLESMDGIRGGSRHRSYSGLPSIKDGAASGEAWYYFGQGDRQPGHPGTWPMATSPYLPPALVCEIAKRRGELGNYQIVSRLPGLKDGKMPDGAGYATSVDDAMAGGVYHLDPQCPSLRRVTYATPAFILGTSMIPVLPREAWTGISGQNHWDGVIFHGVATSRIFVQPKVLSKGSIYNTNTSVQDQGVLLIQRIPPSNAKTQRVWFSKDLVRTEKDGWIFVQAADAYGAIKVVDGKWQWDPDGPDYRREHSEFQPGLGDWLAPENEFSPLIIEVAPKSAYADFDSFQREILANSLKRTTNRLDYSSAHYENTLSLSTDFKEAPSINGKRVDYEPTQVFDSKFLQGVFGEKEIILKAFGQECHWQF